MSQSANNSPRTSPPRKESILSYNQIEATSNRSNTKSMTGATNEYD